MDNKANNLIENVADVIEDVREVIEDAEELAEAAEAAGKKVGGILTRIKNCILHLINFIKNHFRKD